MPIGELIKSFENDDVLPVDLNKVVDWIKEKGTLDEIEFIGVELDTGVIRGYLHRFRYRKSLYGDDYINSANIYYAFNQSPNWINIVCCKELVHVADGGNAKGTKESADELIRRLALPRDLDTLLNDPAHVQMDRFADAFAAAILIPKAARDLLLPRYKSGELTVDDISRMAAVPDQYVRFVLSDRWETLYERMLNV